jgi:AraC-like DNA-binding protein/quercetin dioxygenase-like cupin family protein
MHPPMGKVNWMKDTISDVLETVSLKGMLYFRTDFFAPFAIGVPRYANAARFHVVIQGTCHVTLPSGEHITLLPGDLVLIPRGSEHVLSDAEGRTAIALETVLEQSGYNGEGSFVLGTGESTASTQMICGHFTFADGADHPLLRALPSILHITAEDRARLPILDDLLRMAARRVFEGTQGIAASIARLSEVLYIEVLLAGIDRAPELKRLLQAFSDPQIGRALALVHERPGAAWTVDSLAAEIGMSRSRFADQFRELVGCGPMTYLTDWRLQRARAMLAESPATVKEVAHKVGYQSASAFSRSFSQHFGRPPRAVRSRG